MAFEWTDGNVAALRILYGSMPASKVAEILGASRNGVIGKANRIGLGRRRVAPGAGTVRARKPRVHVVIPEDFGEGVTFWQLGPKQCRWPIAGSRLADFRFCGHRKAEGSYCAAHQVIGTRESEKKARAA